MHAHMARRQKLRLTPGPEYTLRRVISREPIHDERLSKDCK